MFFTFSIAVGASEFVIGSSSRTVQHIIRRHAVRVTQNSPAITIFVKQEIF